MGEFAGVSQVKQEEIREAGRVVHANQRWLKTARRIQCSRAQRV